MKTFHFNTLRALFCLLLFIPSLTFAYQPQFSTAGFFELPDCGREVFSMNPAWRLHKGNIQGAEQREFDDTDWQLVSLPNGIEYVPEEASGCVNYQGEIWYRKHFTPDSSWKGKQLFLHFEAIMGKSKVWINGKLAKEHFGAIFPWLPTLRIISNTGKTM